MAEVTIKRYDVGKVRDIAVSCVGRGLERMRYLLSATPGCEDLADQLRHKNGELLHARMVEWMMAELGHETELTADDPDYSEARRAVKRQRRG